MKIGEARKAYVTQLKDLRSQRLELLKQQEIYNNKLKYEKNDYKAGNDSMGVTLELSDNYKKSMELQEQIDILSKQIENSEKGLDDIINLEVGIANGEVAKQQKDTMKKYAEDVAKCLEIARRIANGDKVPAQDEKKLLDFNYEIYMAAKNMAVMNMDKKHKEYDSLWKDEEEKKEYDDPLETASNTEVNIDIPEVVSLEISTEGNME